MKIGVVILAAGAASRMGKAKMLLPFKEHSILLHILQEVKAIHPASICLVTGKYQHEIETALDKDLVPIVQNDHWSNGMAGSIKLGLANLLQNQPLLDAVILVVSDQPFLDRTVLTNLLDVYKQTGKGMIAANYEGIHGTPVLFAKQYFNELEKLVGDKGASAILQANLDDLATIEFPLGALDIDTEEDYQRLLRLINEAHVKR